MSSQTRHQGIGLLRILSMLFVVLFHINLNVILRNSETSEFLKYIAIAGNSLVAVAVNCFVLISGYFGIRVRVKSFLGLFFQTEFYSVIALVIAILCLGYQFVIPSGLVPFHPEGLWFVPVYVMLYLISPILNQLITSKYVHKSAICVLVSVSLLMYFGGGIKDIVY